MDIGRVSKYYLRPSLTPAFILSKCPIRIGKPSKSAFLLSILSDYINQSWRNWYTAKSTIVILSPKKNPFPSLFAERIFYMNPSFVTLAPSHHSVALSSSPHTIPTTIKFAMKSSIWSVIANVAHICHGS